MGDSLVETIPQFVLGMGSYILFRGRLSASGTANDIEVELLTLAIGAELVIGIGLPVALLFPFLVVAVALNRGHFAHWLSGGLPCFPGVISFSIYLIHKSVRPLGVMIFHAVHPQPATAIEALAFAFVGFMVVIPFAWATYIVVEHPGRRLVRRWTEAGASSSAEVNRQPKSS